MGQLGVTLSFCLGNRKQQFLSSRGAYAWLRITLSLR